MTVSAGLSQDQRQVQDLAYDDGLTQAEIATRLGVPSEHRQDVGVSGS